MTASFSSLFGNDSSHEVEVDSGRAQTSPALLGRVGCKYKLLRLPALMTLRLAEGKGRRFLVISLEAYLDVGGVRSAIGRFLPDLIQ